MTTTQLFFNATLDVAPTMSECEVRWSIDTQLARIVESMENVNNKDDYIFSFPLTENNRIILQHEVAINHIEEDIHYMSIWYEEKKLFVAYDGFEIGKIVPSIRLPKDYIAAFIDTGICIVACNLDEKPIL